LKEMIEMDNPFWYWRLLWHWKSNFNNFIFIVWSYFCTFFNNESTCIYKTNE